VGHNQHIAWGFTNSGADVQDLYLETLTGSGEQTRFRASDGTEKPVRRQHEVIHVKGAKDTEFDLLFTEHSGNQTPIITGILPGETRPIALQWTLYDQKITKVPFFAINTAHDWATFVDAFSTFGGPSQNVVYADDQGHIGYHLIGAIPLRGAPIAAAVSAVAPAAPSNRDPGDIQIPPASTATMLSGPLNPMPVVASAANEWSGYIPYDKLPQVFDPPGGLIATANARIAPDDYPYPITLNWAAPYRNERIWRLLAHRNNLTPADMLAVQTDVYSDLDRVLAERIAYALDHSNALAGNHYSKSQTRQLHQAADLLRTFNGRMTVDSAAAAITSSVHHLLFPALLAPKLGTGTLYRWDEDDYALEQIVMHTPARWLPSGFSNWNDFLTDTTARALSDAKAPGDLSKWRYGSIHTVGVYDTILGQSKPLELLYGRPIGTGERPLSGDRETIKQVAHTFGPSERLTVDLGNPDRTTLNTTMGQSGNPGSPWFLDQFPVWLKGTTLPFAFSDAAIHAGPTHTLTLTP
jgi:penicillin amidase